LLVLVIPEISRIERRELFAIARFDLRQAAEIASDCLPRPLIEVLSPSLRAAIRLPFAGQRSVAPLKMLP
jgi:hypothetical protein